MKQVKDMHSRIKILGLLLAITVGLTSCGSKGPPLVKTLPLEYVPTPVNMPVLPDVHVECPQVSAATDPNITTIVWMVPDSIKGLDKVVSAFEKAYPQIHVEILTVQKQEFFNSPQNKNLKSPDYWMHRAGCAKCES
jgi:ABC-type glycerol-3-phosphate transport system substrate-binding protein